jgi:pimeloyl-ACP methyl ester carboxylesterase
MREEQRESGRVNLSQTHFVIADDGVRLHLRIKGKADCRIPVLYLHGGPGSGLNLAAFETLAGPILETWFPVAYLHQRGVLRSQGTGRINQRLSLHIRDIRSVVSFLRRRYQQRKVHLLAHSWGAFIGCAYLSRYASSVAKFVAICPVVSLRHVQQSLYALVSGHLATGGDPLAYRELASIGPPPYPDIDDFIRLQGLGAEIFGDPYRYIVPSELAEVTGYPLEVDDCLTVQSQIAATLWPSMSRKDLTASLERLTTPVLMIACDEDSAVPWTSVEKAFQAYARRRPEVDKRWLMIKGSNHLPFTEPIAGRQCLDPIIDFLIAN